MGARDNCASSGSCRTLPKEIGERYCHGPEQLRMTYPHLEPHPTPPGTADRCAAPNIGKTSWSRSLGPMSLEKMVLDRLVVGW